MSIYLNRITIIALVLSIIFTSCVQEKNDNWTHFRGNDLSGISDHKGIPVEWNDSTNIEWKVEIEGKGWSSPVIYNNQIWCTTASMDGKQMSVVCIDKVSGETLFNSVVFEPDTIYRIHAINSYATPTPSVEEGFVYVHYGRYGTACYDTKTFEKIWERSDFQCEHVQGPGSSLLVYKDLLMIHMEGVDVRYIVALNKSSGETVWKVDRPTECYERLKPIGRKAYITPLILNANGRDLMISNGSAITIAYDPLNGEEIWRIVAGAESTVAMPVLSNGIIYYYTGFDVTEKGERYSELIAVDPDGNGDIAETNILWRKKTPPMQLMTPLVKDNLIYTVHTDGYMQCIDAASGKTIWSERIKGKYNSSPIWIEGHIYFNSTKGESIVIKEGRELQIVSNNKLDGEIWATPAISDNALFIRTSKYLYKIRETGI